MKTKYTTIDNLPEDEQIKHWKSAYNEVNGKYKGLIMFVIAIAIILALIV